MTDSTGRMLITVKLKKRRKRGVGLFLELLCQMRRHVIWCKYMSQSQNCSWSFRLTDISSVERTVKIDERERKLLTESRSSSSSDRCRCERPVDAFEDTLWTTTPLLLYCYVFVRLFGCLSAGQQDDTKSTWPICWSLGQGRSYSNLGKIRMMEQFQEFLFTNKAR